MNVEPENPAVLNEEPGGPQLDGRQERMVLALLEHPTHDKAAAALGVSTVTLWRATKKPEFAEAYRKARREAFSQSVARLQHASNAAVGTLLRVMTDREAPAASRVRAADVVLQAAFRGMEMEDIEARVAELERADSIVKHRGMFVDKTELTGTDGGAIDVNMMDAVAERVRLAKLKRAEEAE